MSIHWSKKAGFLICFLEHSYLKHTPKSQSDHVAKAQRGSLSGYSSPGSIRTTPTSLLSFCIHWLNRYKQVGRGTPLSTWAYNIIYDQELQHALSELHVSSLYWPRGCSENWNIIRSWLSLLYSHILSWINDKTLLGELGHIESGLK